MQRAGLQRKHQQEHRETLSAKGAAELGGLEEWPANDKVWEILGNKPEALNLCEASSRC